MPGGMPGNMGMGMGMPGMPCDGMPGMPGYGHGNAWWWNAWCQECLVIWAWADASLECHEWWNAR